MKKSLKYLFILVRLLAGAIFIFSGFVKGIDPWGTAYKFSDYFTAMHLSRMEELSLILSFLLSGAEFLIGIALVMGIFPRFTSIMALIFMIFFTIVTFLLAVFNPISDCGCFGDAIKLTNWETFYKNIVLLGIIVFIFIYSKKIESKFYKGYELAVTLLGALVYFYFSIYSYNHLPIIDFMPFREGSNIIEKSSIPSDAPKDEYATQLLYKNKKTGEIKAFSLDNYPWQDTINWQWHETKSILVKKGYVPEIHDFAFYTLEGNNVTDSILSDAFVFLFISTKLNKVDPQILLRFDTLNQYVRQFDNARFYAVTASPTHTIHRILNQYHLTYNFLTADETLLKTMIRSNPGIMLLHNGTVLKKWHYKQFKWNYNQKDILKQLVEEHRVIRERLLIYYFIFVLALLITMNFIAFYLVKKHFCKSQN